MNMDLTNALFNLSFHADTPLGASEPDDHLLKYTVDANAYIGEKHKKKKTGNFSVWRFNVAAYQDKAGCHLYDLFDADSEEAENLFATIFDYDTATVREDLFPGGSFGSDILHFQWATFPVLQMGNLSLAVVERIIECIGGGCCAATLW